ncbi:ACT domain-containing protein [Clostridium sp. D2Q-11]|uniref:ACT domain-containing protein n=1 Tax=Anaeromonas frigoriresistens TaxID=2683708 RepID=A0A942Z6Z9_9FIRM|nr:CBS domain-containing protein [Anaeromonas frigoriresistens]MBS4539016.1 ACT domain-containing protein [Anaeromonas frigoriresistens]
MLIKQAMTNKSELTLLNSSTIVNECIKTIEEKGLLSLPVVDGKTFIGSISINTLYSKLIKLNDEQKHEFLNEKIENYIDKNFKSLSISEELEKSSKMLTDEDLPFIPIVSNGEFQGIIKPKDIFTSMNDVLGSNEGTRITILTYDRIGVLFKITKILNRNNINILNVVAKPKQILGIREITLRIEGENIDRAINKLESKGFKIRNRKYFQT